MYTTKLSEIMTPNPATVNSDDNFEIVDYLFNNNDFHHLPVVDADSKLVGIVSKSDYLTLCDSFSIFKSKISEAQNHRLFKSILVKDVMQKNIAKLNPEHSVMIAAGFFKENLFHAIPVVDAENKLVGIVTTFDLLNLAYAEPGVSSKV